MQTENITTPFGRRMTLGMLKTQVISGSIDAEQSIDKWKIFRAICEAKPVLGVSDRTLAVLNALLTFYPGNVLSAEHGLVVFPSNAQLSARAHGIAPATLRRHLAALIEAGLLIRKDSPNGKRYIRRSASGAATVTYGFSVAPLVARSQEIQLLAAQVASKREAIKTYKEQLSLSRRDVSRLIETAIENGVPGNWTDTLQTFLALIRASPRKATLSTLTDDLEQISELRKQVLNLLELHIKPQKTSAYESQIERHIQKSESDSIFESEAVSENEGDTSRVDGQHETSVHNQISVDENAPAKRHETSEPAVSAFTIQSQDRVQRPTRTLPSHTSYPLEMILRACPGIVAYGPGGRISNWRDLIQAAAVVRSFFGVSPSAYNEACSTMGPENAATTVACLLERAGEITSVGGYLRALSHRAGQGRFTIGPMIASLLRASDSQNIERQNS